MIRPGGLFLVVFLPVTAFGATGTAIEADSRLDAPHPRFGETAVAVKGTHSATITYLDTADENFTWFLSGSLREQASWAYVLRDDCTASGGAKLKPSLSCATLHSGSCGFNYQAETGASMDYPIWAGPGPGDSDTAEASPLCNYTSEPVPVVNTPCGGSCSPIVINLDGAGFRFTSLEDGVSFDVDADGEDERLAWTAPGGGDAFLVLDRNGNGRIDHGAELFGSVTPQPASAQPNGFAALGVFDQPAAGGNGDGVISAADPIYSRLGLWIDADHDAIADPSEIEPLSSRGLQAIDLVPVVSERRDRHGNRSRWASHVLFAHGLRLAAVDVLFLKACLTTILPTDQIGFGGISLTGAAPAPREAVGGRYAGRGERVILGLGDQGGEGLPPLTRGEVYFLPSFTRVKVPKAALLSEPST